jgi:hypothetical protein
MLLVHRHRRAPVLWFWPVIAAALTLALTMRAFS